MSDSDGSNELLRFAETLDLGSPSGPIPFVGRGNIWINDPFDEQSVAVARHAIYSAIKETQRGQLRVIGYDESLSGLFAPFSAIAEGERRIVDLLEDSQELSEKLAYLRHEVRSVQNVIQGRTPSLAEYRQSTGRPIEQYQLVVLSMRWLGFKELMGEEERLRNEIRLLMGRGPAAGITFLIIADAPQSRTFPNVAIVDPQGVDRGRLASSGVESIIADCRSWAYQPKPTKQETITFMETMGPERPFWGADSTDGVSFRVGMYGTDPLTVTIGDELNQRHNVLVTGAVGQGKSNLLSVIIHSICWDYSPDQVELYLLDFKEGVTFKAYAPEEGSSSFLVQARTIGLDSDVEFGECVLGELNEEYQRRMRMLKEHNVRSLKELREQNPGISMPRIIVVIDEFQLMFGEGNQAQKIAEQLELSVRLYRAAGIHFILSSQTLESNVQMAQHRDAIFGQVPIRIALKNSLAESCRTLAPDNPAAAYLRPREAIVNLDYGAVSQNKKVTVAFADERVLAPIRDEWFRLWVSRDTAQPLTFPFVYARDRPAYVGTDDLVRVANSEVPTLLLGKRVSIGSELLELPMPDDPGRSLAIIGAEDRETRTAAGMLQACALSVAARDDVTEVVLCDLKAREGAGVFGDEPFADALAEQRANVRVVQRDEFEDALKQVLVDGSGKRFVVAANMDNWIPDSSGFGDTALQEFVKRGPSVGAHLVGWWIRESNFQSHVGLGNDPFNAKAFLFVDEREVQRHIGVGATWKPSRNRCLVVDKVELPGNVAFVPYRPVKAGAIGRAGKEA